MNECGQIACCAGAAIKGGANPTGAGRVPKDASSNSDWPC